MSSIEQQRFLECLKALVGTFVAPEHERDFEWDAKAIGPSFRIKVRVNRADMMRLVGRAGQHWRAIETMARLMGEACGIHVTMKLMEPEVGERVVYPDFAADPGWPRGEVFTLVDGLMSACFTKARPNVKLEDDDGETLVLVEVAASEPKEKVAEVMKAMSTLMDTTGKSRGRRLLFFLDPKLEEDPPQPSGCDGRYAGEAMDRMNWRH